MRFARVAAALNPSRWRARYVLWATCLIFIGAIVWGVDTYRFQLERDAKAEQLWEQFGQEEKVLSREGYDFADVFVADLRGERVEQAWSKYKRASQKPDARRDLEGTIKYIQQKSALTRPKATLLTGQCRFPYWRGVNYARPPKLVYTFSNADDLEVPFFIEITVVVEDGAPRIESCGYMALVYRGQ